jgi:signal transduction histidine kinase
MRRRIVGLTVLASLLSLCLFGIPLALGASYYFASSAHAEVERLAYGVASASSDNLALGNQLATLQHPGADIRVGLYGPRATLVSGQGSAADEPLIRRALTGRAASGELAGRWAVAVPVRDTSRVTGAVLATAGQTHTRTLIALTWIGMTALVAAALTVSWLVARRQVARLVAPLERLSGAAERLGAGDFGQYAQPVGVAEIDSLNASLTDTDIRLSSLIERERSFAANASHQLRTPLTGLRLALETALAQSRDPRPAMKQALVSIDRLDATVTDMLHVKHRTSASEPLPLSQLLDAVQGRWNSFHLTDRRLTLQVADPLPIATLSLSGARQILNVMLDNAARHGTGTVTVTVRAADRALAIDVSQDGPPITRQASELFADNSEKGTGTGMGLALARRLAHDEGARLVLSNCDPPTFTLHIPSEPHAVLPTAADRPR